MKEELYYVISNDLGVTLFDLSNDSMSSISANCHKNEWIKFTKEEAKEVARIIGFDIIPVN